MARELLKFRKGDQGLKISQDGKIELAGVEDKPLIDADGHMSPIILFAAAWARKGDANVFKFLFENFKQAVREGRFGFDAKRDLVELEEFQKAAAASAAATMQSASGATTMPNFKPNMTEEEHKKQKEEEARLEAYTKNIDPRVQKQQAALKKGAKVLKVEEFSQHKLPDLPIEQTMAYQEASPEEQKKMKEEESNKIKGYGQEDINDESQTIEKEIGNENK